MRLRDADNAEGVTTEPDDGGTGVSPTGYVRFVAPTTPPTL